MEELETEVQTEETTETTETPETATEEKQPETRESVIDKIKGLISKHNKPEPETAEVEVPNDFSVAARASFGWSDEKIQEFAKDFNEEELLEMIPEMIGEDSEESEEASDTAEKETPKETKESQDEDSQEDERIQKLLDRIEALEKAQSESSKNAEVQEMAGFARKASEEFDRLADEFKVFGKTEKLPKFPDGRLITSSPAMKARTAVWDLAVSLKGTGMDFNDAFSTAVNAFKGKHLANDVKRNVIKDLKDRESKLSGKRTTHESTQTPENGVDVIRAVARKHGKEIN